MQPKCGRTMAFSTPMLSALSVLIVSQVIATGAVNGPSAAQWVQLRSSATESEASLGQVVTHLFGLPTIPGGVRNVADPQDEHSTGSWRPSGAWTSHITASKTLPLKSLNNNNGGVLPEELKLISSLWVNEMASPGARVVERLQQLGQVALDLQYSSGACGTYSFNPGGAAVNAKWTGPIFELTQTTGNCVVEPSFNGGGNTRWTQLQGRLACLGPTTQYSWKPLEYTGVSNEPTSLQGPECKTEVKFGADVSVTLYGGDKKTSAFPTEKDFYAAVMVTKTLDFDAKPLRTALENFSSRLSTGKLHLKSLLQNAAADSAAHVVSSTGTGTWVKYVGVVSPSKNLATDPGKTISDALQLKGVGQSMFARRW